MEEHRRLEIATAEYIDWFNHRRLHGEIGLMSPAKFEADHYRHNTAPTTVDRVSSDPPRTWAGQFPPNQTGRGTA